MKKLTLKAVLNDIEFVVDCIGENAKIIDINLYGNGEYCTVLVLHSHIVWAYNYYSSDIDDCNRLTYRKCKMLL